MTAQSTSTPGRYEAVPLIGRSAELGHLVETLNRVAAGRSRTILVEGEAGIGKTRLIEAFIDEVSRAGFATLTGRAEELERKRPFGAILEALAAVDRSGDATERSQRLLALCRNGSASEHQLVEGLLEVAEERAIASPLAFIIEDLHWTDPTTIIGIRAVQRRLGYLPILLVGTHRPHPEGPELATFIDAASREGATLIRVNPLDDVPAMELASTLLGSRVGEGVHRAVALAAGNPLYVTEVVRSLLEEGSITVADGIADATIDSLPATLCLTILKRLSFLPADTIELLRSASIFGSSFRVDELAAVTDSDVHHVVVTLASAIASKVIVERGDRLSFRHDLIQEAIHQDIPTPIRESLHLETARTLDRLSAPLPRVAEQLLRAGQATSPEVIELITNTAADLRSPAPRLAIDLYEHAIPSVDREQARRLRAKTLIPLAAVGRGHDAIMHAEQILADPMDPDTEARIKLSRIEIKARDGRGTECIPELIAMAEDVRLPESWRLSARASLAGLYMRVGLPESALAPAERVVSEARTTGQHRALAAGLSTLACVMEFRGYPSRAIPMIMEALPLNEVYTANIDSPHAQLIVFLFQADRFADATRMGAEGIHRAQEAGDISAIAPLTAASAFMRFLEGDWDAARADAESALELISAGLGSTTGMMMAYAGLAQISLRRGENPAALRAVGQARAEIEDRGSAPWSDCIEWCEALSLEASGDLEGAAELCWKGWESATMRYSVAWRLIVPDLIRLSLMNGLRDRARVAAEDAREGARRAGEVASARGAALRCQGLLADDPEILRAARDEYLQTPRIFERAMVTEETASSLARHGLKADAKPSFEEALSFYERVGDVVSAARVRASMRAAGIRRGSRAPRKRPATGWASLTPSEQQVARLAAEGLMNRQIAERLFVSKYTVMTHLSHVFGKLGISSRVELAAAAARAPHPESPD